MLNSSAIAAPWGPEVVGRLSIPDGEADSLTPEQTVQVLRFVLLSLDQCRLRDESFSWKGSDGRRDDNLSLPVLFPFSCCCPLSSNTEGLRAQADRNGACEDALFPHPSLNLKKRLWMSELPAGSCWKGNPLVGFRRCSRAIGGMMADYQNITDSAQFAIEPLICKGWWAGSFSSEVSPADFSLLFSFPLWWKTVLPLYWGLAQHAQCFSIRYQCLIKYNDAVCCLAIGVIVPPPWFPASWWLQRRTSSEV